MYKLINLTPHDIYLYRDGSLDDKDKLLLTVPSTGVIARVEQSMEKEGYIGLNSTLQDGRHISVPIVKSKYGKISGLPAPQENTIYIVSGIVAQQANRDDVVFPTDFVRDDKNRIIGCRAFSKV